MALKATLCNETIGQIQVLCFPLLNQEPSCYIIQFLLIPPLLITESTPIFPVHVSLSTTTAMDTVVLISG